MGLAPAGPVPPSSDGIHQGNVWAAFMLRGVRLSPVIGVCWPVWVRCASQGPNPPKWSYLGLDETRLRPHFVSLLTPPPPLLWVVSTPHNGANTSVRMVFARRTPDCPHFGGALAHACSPKKNTQECHMSQPPTPPPHLSHCH